MVLAGFATDKCNRFITFNLVDGAGDKAHKGFIKWNFTKFLFNSEGNIVERFGPNTAPESIEEKIKELL